MGFAVQADHKVKNQRKQKERKVLRPYQRTKKAMEYEGDGDWRARNDP